MPPPEWSVAPDAPGESAAAVAPQARLAGLLPGLYHHAAGAVRAVPRVPRAEDPVHPQRVIALPAKTCELSFQILF